VSPHGAAGRGVFLTIEGPEGAGKTTQSERLRDALAADGTEVVLTREPGGTALGERIRDVLLTVAAGTPHDPRADALLFNAARAQLVAEVIRPALERGAVVISTRFADSTLAYQGYGAGLPIGDLRAIEAFATGGLSPDRTILLDVPVETGLGRKGGEELTRFETAFDVDFHRRVRAGFLALAALEPARFVVIEASRDAAAVAADVLAAALGAARSAAPPSGSTGGRVRGAQAVG
jgi:dTMP kinase